MTHRIRWMIPRDAPEVLEISQHSSNPMEEKDLHHILKQRNCIGMVVDRQPEEIVDAFMIYELHFGYLNILHFTVHPEVRRTGIGSMMLSKMTGKLKSHRRTRIEWCVPDDDLGTHLFLRFSGFKAVKIIDKSLYVFEYCLPLAMMAEEIGGEG